MVANEAPPALDSADPRVSGALDRPLIAAGQDVHGTGALLLHRARASGLLMAAGMDHWISAPGEYDVDTIVRGDLARTTVVCTLRPGQRLRLVKYLGYGWSAHRSETAVRDQVAAALAGARHAGWEGLSRAQREYLDQFWADADVEIDDPALQQALRFGLYHVLQASARAERRAIGAKGLTGPGYDGHAFWDTEGFVLPLLMLRPCRTPPPTRCDGAPPRSPLATRRARALDLDGAAFPWRTINGAESGPYWPAGTAAFHVNADIACAFDNYRQTTADDELERECGLEVLVQTARLWHSIGHHDRHGRWHVDGVTGPDEYTALVSDNVFTNLMAARNLAAAAEACTRHPRMAEDLGVTTEEAAAWLASADAVHIPYDEELGVHPQCGDFTRYAEWDFAASAATR